jgi:sugar O-acyltransferase (sialic acid O-acetyltransferase NeuD family)
MNSETRADRLVIFGLSNFLSDIFDCALANGLVLHKVVVHHAEKPAPRDVPLTQRLEALARIVTPPAVQALDAFRPGEHECYLLGPTTPKRAALARELNGRHGLMFCTLVHPTAYVSPLAELGQGVFVGARSVIAPGARLGEHVCVNRGVTIGHDTSIGAFSRIQPGANLGGLSTIGNGVTIGLGATLIERLVLGDGVTVGAGAVLLQDLPPGVVAAGVPARIK